jgi:hypothetical protein
MRNGRILQAIGATVLGLALAAGPVVVATSAAGAATHHKTHKPKHHTKTVKVNAGDCKGLKQVSTGIGGIGTGEAKALEQGITNFAGAKAAMLKILSQVTAKENAAEAALSGAPKNVQNALKGLFSTVTAEATAIQNSSSFQQLASSLSQTFAGKQAQLENDATIVGNYFASACGATP